MLLDPAFQSPEYPESVHGKIPQRVTTISWKMVKGTAQYLETVSDHILISDTISSKGWATIYLATALLQSSYEYLLLGKEMEYNTLFVFDPLSESPERKCRKVHCYG